MDRLTEMEAFIRVVEQGGFTDAADKLGVSKSAVSKHISSLETRLGVRLLNRTTRRVSPTEIGLSYFDRAKQVLADAAEADQMVTAMQSSPKGALRISVPTSFGIRHCSAAISDFLTTYPQVTAKVVLEDRRVDLLAEGFDLAIRIGHMDNSSLMSRKLSETRMLFVASPEYLARKGIPETVEDLSNHDLLQYTSNAVGNHWRVVGKNGEERLIRAGGPMSSDNGDTLLMGALAGLGIAFTPGFFMDGAECSDQKLKVILENHPQPKLPIHIVYPPGRYVQPKTRAFIDHMVDWFKERDEAW